jgi:type I restriction enzyme M protein
MGELNSARATVTADIEALGTEAEAEDTAWAKVARDNAGLNTARSGLRPLADRCRDLTKEIDLAVKLAGRVIDIAVKELAARDADTWNNAEVNKIRKTLVDARRRRSRRYG